MTDILLIGHGAREHVIAETLMRSKHSPRIFSYLSSRNPGIISLSEDFLMGNYDDIESIINFAWKSNPDFAFIGPENPLEKGIVDALESISIPSIGPKKVLAQLETDKAFTRELIEEFNINGNPRFEIFTRENISEAKHFLESLESAVIKPSGLTGGKGVKVQGDHFQTKEEVLAYIHDILKKHPKVVIEEKLEGEEFSLMCLTDGKEVIPFPPVQDHKRAYDKDLGPNTGGMGSYSDRDFLLPFLTKKDVEDGLDITQEVIKGLYQKTGVYYKGIIYAGLIATSKGVKIIEYNARFGDPEVMNVLPILKTDFVELCRAVINQDLERVTLDFEKKATVCKYLVPEGYPENPKTNQKINIRNISGNSRLYYASVYQQGNDIYTTSSRSIACVGIADDLSEAEKIAEESVHSIRGNLFHRKDIGTNELIQKRVNHMRLLRS